MLNRADKIKFSFKFKHLRYPFSGKKIGVNSRPNYCSIFRKKKKIEKCIQWCA